MAWTAPMTATANSAWTAVQWNAHVRDNSLETMPGVASGAARWFVASAGNAIANRAILSAVTAASSTTTSTSYANLADAVNTEVTLTTGTQALVFYSAEMSNATSDATTYTSFAVSGASTVAASDTNAAMLDGVTGANANRLGGFTYVALTAGSNVFTLKYRVISGTATILRREIIVLGM